MTLINKNTFILMQQNKLEKQIDGKEFLLSGWEEKTLDFRLTAELFLILVQSSNGYRLIRS